MGGGLCHAGWTDVPGEETAALQGPLRLSLLSAVIENHVKGQLCGAGCPSLNAAALSQNMTTAAPTGWQLLA